MKKVLVKVMVQLPDGTFSSLPVAQFDEFSKPVVVSKSSKREAREWTIESLPKQIALTEIEEL